ncbi:MAG: hypothetical protein ACREPW_00345, partial [Candidatus Binataceae bacterium]
MGLASGIHWPHARGSISRKAAEVPTTRSSPTELLTIDNEYWGALMLRVSAVVIIVFQSAYL